MGPLKVHDRDVYEALSALYWGLEAQNFRYWFIVSSFRAPLIEILRVAP